MSAPDSSTSFRTLCCIGAAVALGHALQISNGFNHGGAFAWLTGAIAACALAVAWPARLRPPHVSVRTLELVLAAGLVWQLTAFLLAEPGIHLDKGPEQSRAFIGRLGVALVPIAALAGARRGGVWKLIPVLGMCAAHFALGAWILAEMPDPPIDVFVFQRDGARALLDATNPYAITFPDLYGASSPFYGPGVVVDGRLQFGYPYPPLGLVLAAPAEAIAGESRYAQLLAIELSAVLVAYIRPGRVSALAAALFLFTPRVLYVLQMSWTEPYVVLLFVMAVFAAVRVPRAFPFVLGLFIASKQLSILALPIALLLLPRPWTARGVGAFCGKAAMTAVAVTLPFFIIDPASFIHSTIVLHLVQPFRPDSLSYLALLGGGAPLPAALTLLPVSCAIALGLWRAPRDPSGFAAAAAFAFLALFAFGVQAHCNYYFFVIGVLCTAIASSAGLAPDRERSAV